MFWLIVGMLFLTLAIALYMFVLGLRAWWRGRQQYDSRRLLRLLALNLCEPLVSGVLVLLFALTDIPWGTSDLWTGWSLTAPMLVMFIPIIYLRSQDLLYSARSKTLLMLGFARWGLTLAALLSLFFEISFVGAWFPAVPLALCLLSIGVLCYAAFRGRRIFHELADAPTPAFPGFPEDNRSLA